MIPTRHPVVAALVAWTGLVAVSERWLSERRPASPELRAAHRIVVTSAVDGGPGSLREAIYAADRAGERALVEVDVARIALRTPLPPLVNPDGVVIDAERSRCEIDASAVSGPVLDLAAPRSVVRGLRIRGAADQGILVRLRGARILSVGLADCGEGVHLVEGADDVQVLDSVFEANGTGVRLPPAPSGIVLSGNRFSRHEQAGVWAVAAAPPSGVAVPGLVLRDNRFDGDRIGIVLIHSPAEVERNELLGARESAIYLTGGGVLRSNRIRGGASVGVFGDGTEGALLEDNEIDRNFAVGILLRAARTTTVRRNRISLNGYGIAIVSAGRGAPSVVADNLILSQQFDGLFVVGGSPVLQGNRVLGSGSAGLRLLDLVPLRGPRQVAEPLLQGNVLRNNRLGETVRGEYRVRSEAEAR